MLQHYYIQYTYRKDFNVININILLNIKMTSLNTAIINVNVIFSNC